MILSPETTTNSNGTTNGLGSSIGSSAGPLNPKRDGIEIIELSSGSTDGDTESGESRDSEDISDSTNDETCSEYEDDSGSTTTSDDVSDDGNYSEIESISNPEFIIRSEYDENTNSNTSSHPPYYIEIHRNLYVSLTADLLIQSQPIDWDQCDCDSLNHHFCEESGQCTNRMMQIECTENTCTLDKNECRNRRFQKKEWKQLRVDSTHQKGWGLFTEENIAENEFIIEYIGELIDTEECQRRIREDYAMDKAFYLMKCGQNVIDAKVKGNAARFINHSCDPNCKVLEWKVDHKSVLGIFAIRDIRRGEELTFDYNFKAFGAPTQCFCGASKCKKFLGKNQSKNGKRSGRTSRRNGNRNERNDILDLDVDDDDDIEEFQDEDNVDILDMTEFDKSQRRKRENIKKSKRKNKRKKGVKKRRGLSLITVQPKTTSKKKTKKKTNKTIKPKRKRSDKEEMDDDADDVISVNERNGTETGKVPEQKTEDDVVELDDRLLICKFMCHIKSSEGRKIIAKCTSKTQKKYTLAVIKDGDEKQIDNDQGHYDRFEVRKYQRIKGVEVMTS